METNRRDAWFRRLGSGNPIYVLHACRIVVSIVSCVALGNNVSITYDATVCAERRSKRRVGLSSS